MQLKEKALSEIKTQTETLWQEIAYLGKKLTMNPKLICFVILLLTGLASRAQDRRTLQISEMDTVLLNPTSIEYIISIGTTPRFSVMDNGENKKGTSGSEEPPPNMQTVRTVLQNHHITWETSREKAYAIGQSFSLGGDSPIVITV